MFEYVLNLGLPLNEAADFSLKRSGQTWEKIVVQKPNGFLFWCLWVLWMPFLYKIAGIFVVRVYFNRVKRPVDRIARLRVKITLGKVLILMFFSVVIPGSLRNVSRLYPSFWVQKENVQFRQSTLKRTLFPAEVLRQFLSYSPFFVFWDLCYVVLSI